MSWSQNNDTISFTGEQQQIDTFVLVPTSALRIANAKMIELKYEKEINEELRKVIINDSTIIKKLQISLENNAIEYNTKIKKIKKQRNIFIGTTAGVSLLFLLLLLK